ncbi:Crp/Fnr family transcriptional regulator [Flavobacterium sp.]|uniref:Crp/Fnr family transcriptional regulator n=1 Tax=Flavobacterium sp. TaxID=239 RepID=UPI00286D5883|nr:Crp/Fnr family transcriptional regulator [Flavobacterium sp.]
MHDELRKSLNHFVAITDDEFNLFLARMKPKTLKKNEYFLRQGEVCHNAVFLIKGCVRYYFNIDGEEKTGQFFFESSWYTDLESFVFGEPSEQNIQALENSECLIISKKDLHELYESSHTFEKFGRLLVEYGFLGLRKKNKLLTNMSPEERYLDLLKNRPKVIERIPQIYIASYLGIQPESLSRIRKRIFNQKK